jgi:hypothetical protein
VNHRLRLTCSPGAGAPNASPRKRKGSQPSTPKTGLQEPDDPASETQERKPKGKRLEPWDIEIGKTVTEERITVIETDTHIQLGGGPDIAKQDLADILGCGRDEKCWSVALSGKPWPFKLHLCNHSKDDGVWRD